jgi:hypothetical protein
MDLTDTYRQAMAAQQEGRLDEAERCYLDIVAAVEHPVCLHNLGAIYDRTGRVGSAGQWYRRAAAAAPDDPDRHAALGVHLRTVRDFVAAEAALRRVLALDPDFPAAAADLGIVLLAQGRLKEAWPLQEHRPARVNLAKSLSTPEWRGESLAGKRLFIWREGGFGDQILAARFLPQLRDAASVVYAGLSALQRLFEPLGVEYLPAEGGIKAPAHDVWSLPLSLPHCLGATLETLPPAPYLSGRARPAGGRIGVVWRGSPANRNEPFRALPEAAGRRLLSLPGAISLEPQDTGAQDFQDTADIIAGLDLVISVDTSVAHLAGAMGRPVWVLLAAHALDWQWPRTERTAWYSSARIFSQTTPGDWDEVVGRVIEAARDLPAAPGGAGATSVHV